jgi:hypothetical protein
MESEVETALSMLLDDKASITADAVKALVMQKCTPTVPEMTPPTVDLQAYDRLLKVLA